MKTLPHPRASVATQVMGPLTVRDSTCSSLFSSSNAFLKMYNEFHLKHGCICNVQKRLKKKESGAQRTDSVCLGNPNPETSRATSWSGVNVPGTRSVISSGKT